MSENKGCSGNCQSCGSSHKSDDCRLKLAMGSIARKLVVMSGKGGVGKSTVSANLARTLAARGFKVGLLDVDLHGPSIPKMLGLEGVVPESTGEKLIPVEGCGVKVVSIAFLLEDPDSAVVWRGPAKIGVIKQLLEDVEWGELDYLVVDCPPGTGDEPLSVCQMTGENTAAVIVTTPQQVSVSDVAKSLNFCNQLGMPVSGLVENMSGFVCPHCGEVTNIFSTGGGEKLAERFKVPFAGRLPIDPRICQSGDAGIVPEVESVTKLFDGIVDCIVANA